MPTLIAITRVFSVTALLDIEDAEFAHWYGLGLWWVMYGDYQGNGPYEDSYLIDNINRGIRAGWYNELNSQHLRSTSFYLGMIHGGMLEPWSHRQRMQEAIVVLTDHYFTNGYHARRQAPFVLSDTTLMRLLHAYASEHPLSYELSTWIGSLSSALIPATTYATLATERY